MLAGYLWRWNNSLWSFTHSKTCADTMHANTHTQKIKHTHILQPINVVEHWLADSGTRHKWECVTRYDKDFPRLCVSNFCMCLCITVRTRLERWEKYFKLASSCCISSVLRVKGPQLWSHVIYMTADFLVLRIILNLPGSNLFTSLSVDFYG